MALSNVIEARASTRLRAALFAPRPIAQFGLLDEADLITSHIPPLVSCGGQAWSSPSRRVLITSESYPTSGAQVVAAASPAEASWNDWLNAAKQLLQQTVIAEQKEIRSRVPLPNPTAAATLRVGRVTAVQAAFGFSAATLADILRVSRPALYKWLDIAQDVTLRPENQRRLAKIEALASKWRASTNAPLNALANEPVIQERTVLDFLKDEAIDENAIAGAFEALLRKIVAQPKTPSQKMAEAGFKRRPALSSLPPDE